MFNHRAAEIGIAAIITKRQRNQRRAARLACAHQRAIMRAARQRAGARSAALLKRTTPSALLRARAAGVAYQPHLAPLYALLGENSGASSICGGGGVKRNRRSGWYPW